MKDAYMIMSDVWGQSWRDRLIVLISITLLVFGNVPGTIALRNTLLVVALLLALGRLSAFRGVWNENRWPIASLGGFMVYGTLHCLFMAQWPAWARGEFASQMGLAFLWFIIGLSLFRRRRGASFLDLTIVAGTILALVEFGHGAWMWASTGNWPFMETYTTASHLEFTFFMNLVLAFVLGVFCFGYRQAVPLTKFPRWSLLLITALIVFVSIRAGARNGMIGLVYLSLSLLAMFMIFNGGKLGVARAVALCMAVLVFVGGLAMYSYHKDSRNSVFTDSVICGWNYNRTTAWFDGGPLPVMPDGREVDDSAYKRVAWIHKGLGMIAEQPLGVGYARGAFGMELKRLGYPNPTVAHSHSGMIDLGVGLGIPGVILWLAFCGSLIVIGFRAFAVRGEILGLVLMLITCGFIGRMMIESIMRDHMVLLFLFSAAALLAEMQSHRENRE
jgi:hypothetical protein